MSQIASAAVPPLSESARLEMATTIIVGHVVSVESTTEELRYGKNTVYTVVLLSDDGEYFSFQYWQALERPLRWAGPSGQYGHPQVGEHIRAYLAFDQESRVFKLLTPNGFDRI